ncbi:unnamed protein product [Rotaria sp. Silwood1]|nr:unnamed protein product [Rotaria sp. Silwood1]CAF1665044.1 unnamed protein product [Rotaria sp. Silwood1]
MADGADTSNDKELLKLKIQAMKQERLLEQDKIQVEKEITKRELAIAKEKTQREVAVEKEKTQREVAVEKEITKREVAIEKERQITKRMKIEHQVSSSSINNLAKLISDHDDFFNIIIRNVQSLDINKELNDNVCLNGNVYLNESTIKIIRDYHNKVSFMLKINESDLQVALNTLILDLLNSFNDCTLLKYVDTHKLMCINEKFRPDCCFLYKNVNININTGRQFLQDFMICVGEFKKSNNSPTGSSGQMLQYLHLLLDVQKNRNKIYGFFVNNEQITFVCVKNGSKSDSYDYYQSQNLYLFGGYSKESVNMNITDEEWKNKYLNEVTWSIFINFLTMNEKFYEYTTLNIDPYDNFLVNEYDIESKLGNGLTSMVYLLVKNANNSLNDIKPCVIKISKDISYEKYFQNEVQRTNELKQLNGLEKFNLFFQDILNFSPKGRFIIFESQLKRIKSLELTYLKQLIDIIQCLYESNIVHRDIRPQNWMLDSNEICLKLIDFSFAIKYETAIESSISGTITYASQELLTCYLKSFSTESYSRSYHYERTFDWTCALNVIIYMVYNNVKHQLNAIEELSDTCLKAEWSLELWKTIEKKNKIYSDLLNLINKLNESPDFDGFKDKIENLILIKTIKI